MKKITTILLVAILLGVISGCAVAPQECQVVATTLPVYDFTSRLCEGTGITVGRLITENVSCLHDYSLQVSQMRKIEAAELVVISGAGLEDFLGSALDGKDYIDSSADVHIHEAGDQHNDENHGHSHDADPHIWLSSENAKVMSENIFHGLCLRYPEHKEAFTRNLTQLHSQLDALQTYGEENLKDLSCRQIITFHDGFGYFAESFDLTILEAVEEESGSEASAKEIIHLAQLIREHKLSSLFIERSGSDACANILAAETGANIYTLDMAMAGDSYFDAMYHNIDTIKEALK